MHECTLAVFIYAKTIQDMTLLPLDILLIFSDKSTISIQIYRLFLFGGFDVANSSLYLEQCENGLAA